MISRKTFLILCLLIFTFTAVYLFWVKQQREASIVTYFPNPKVGDIYKIKKETRDDGIVVFYLKVKDIGNESIYFYSSKLLAGTLHDSFLKQFDTTEVNVYTKKELTEIKQGKWLNNSKQNTQLLEIERN